MSYVKSHSIPCFVSALFSNSSFVASTELVGAANNPHFHFALFSICCSYRLTNFLLSNEKMDGIDYREMLNVLKNPDSYDVLKVLLKIKSFVRNNFLPNELLELDVIKEIIELLRNPFYRHVCLSIIADACNKKNVIEKVIHCNGSRVLMEIMENSSDKDEKNRACRALSNIAQCYWGFKDVHSIKPLPHILRFLAETTDPSCQITAIKTLGILGKGTEHINNIVRENGFTLIAKFLHSDTEDVVLSCTKALARLTTNCPIGVSEFSEVSFIESLVQLYSHSNKSVSESVRVTLQNLSNIDDIRCSLVLGGAFELFLNMFTSSKSVDGKKIALPFLLNLIGYISVVEITTVTLKCALKEILEILFESDFQKFHQEIFHCLCWLCQSEGCFDILMDLDIISILSKILKEFISRNKEVHYIERSNMGQRNIAVECNDTSNEVRFIPHLDVVPVQQRARAPVATFIPSTIETVDDATSDCQKKIVPSNNGFVITSEFNSSKKVSKFEKTTEFSKNLLSGFLWPGAKCKRQLSQKNQTNSCDTISVSKKRKIEFCQDNTFFSNHNNNLSSASNSYLFNSDYYVLSCLKNLYSQDQKKVSSKFANRSFFTVVMDYLCKIHHPLRKAVDLLKLIITNDFFFEKLVINDFASELEKRITMNFHDLRSCNYCHEKHDVFHKLYRCVQKQHQSDYGFKTMGHILFRGEEKVHQYNALRAMSNLTVDPNQLYEILVQSNGLRILRQFIKDPSEYVRYNAITSLCRLYQNLSKGSVSEKCCIHGTCCKFEITSCAYKTAVVDTTFIVDGVSIKASRDMLCNNSDYFEALLRGNFSESQQEVISMVYPSAEVLTKIFHFLHGCKTETPCADLKRIPVDILLGMLGQCEKYLLFDVKSQVEDMLCHNLNPNNVAEIYRVGKLFNSSALSNYVLKYVLHRQDVCLVSDFFCYTNAYDSLDVFHDLTKVIDAVYKSRFTKE